MVKLRCQDCGSVIDGTTKDIDESECECGGSYALLNSEDVSCEQNKCSHCTNNIGNYETYECEECGDSNICEECMVMELKNVNICKKCVDKAYHRKIETKIEYKEKIIEKPTKVFVDQNGASIHKSFNPTAKSKFD